MDKDNFGRLRWTCPHCKLQGFYLQEFITAHLASHAPQDGAGGSAQGGGGGSGGGGSVGGGGGGGSVGGGSGVSA
ncbi:unnamed protein product [Triticum turgidum subsp. durum]|uniref:Uncharacterized protein n=1 Tax=Triticum turgidum subsp. durum TaxID=4567 RepID=A0A9R1R2M5_TRITD|nr:unnamed protein product [Triticum turgidum subsp. durum]